MKTFKKYLITILVGLSMAGMILWLKDIGTQTQAEAIFHILCDAFFVVGVVMLGGGLLVFTSNEGTFDMIKYGCSAFADLFRKHGKRKYATYYDYRVARAEKKLGFGFLLICGAIFTTISLIMYLFYLQYAA
ncbi:MAG: DUF3899 domain-containing protein [Clostridia bacterium]|nr:DUF3899 domain-containing protein [Clostridia bacterium]